MKIRSGIQYLLLLYFIFNEQIVLGQRDSLILYSNNIKIGMSFNQVDSLLPFRIAKNYKAGGGTWRYIYNNTYQASTDYQDKDWNSYTFRMLYRMDKLIYIDLHNYREQKVLFAKVDSSAIEMIVNSFNKQYSANDKFESILQSFYTTTYSLEPPLDDFFSTAGPGQKAKLFSYAKSLCPEYSASAMIRLLELEKSTSFLTESEKTFLKSLMGSDVEIKFVIGCVFEQSVFRDFIEEYRKDLKDVIR